MRQLFYLILFIFAARWLVKTMRAAQSQATARAGTPGSGANGGFGPRAARPASAASAPPLAAEPVVRCDACGVHAPASDSIVVGQQHFCCVEHAKQYAARPAGRDAR